MTVAYLRDRKSASLVETNYLMEISSECFLKHAARPCVFTSMKFIPIFAAVIAISSAFTQPASASTPSQVTPVRWIVDTQHNMDVDDKAVTLVGQVVKKDGGSDWWFTDATGSVRLDTGDMELPIGQTLVVRGRIDQARFGIGYLEVEVNHWNYANTPR